MVSAVTQTTEPTADRPRMRFGAFVWLVLLLVGLGILRSAIATRFDSFTLDEAYHITSGVSYVRYRDFRLNPEHPPLVKLWVGSVIAATGFQSESLRKFSDKQDERQFTQRLVYQKNDPDSVQRRARAALFVLNGLLLIALAFALERVFNAWVALGTLLFLVIDPTVAAHWPVVMTDLPVALLSAISIVLATQAFRDWIWTDLAACSLFLGLDLAAKHSAPAVLLIVTVIGMWLTFWRRSKGAGDSRAKRLLKIACVLAGALTILWGFYLFRYHETRTGEESFNRALADKIKDVGTPHYHAILVAMDKTRVVPRAYLWGFADTVHAGMEGRPFPQLIFGRVYLRKGPKYFFPVMILLKLPIGLSVLWVSGLIFFLVRRLPPESNFPAGVILAAALLFLAVLAAGSTYAGIRHALPVVVLLSIFAGLFAERTLTPGMRSWKLVTVMAYALACISALPVLRPWEYFNEIIGGSKNAYKYFSDEGVDLGQRSKEMVEYYRQYLKPKGEMADVIYYTSDEELKGRDVEYLGRDLKRDIKRLSDPERSGTIFVSPTLVFPSPWWDCQSLREATPVTRFGNLFVLKGKFHVPGLAASAVYWEATKKLYTEKPDDAAAEELFRRSAQLDPTAYFVFIDLGNLLLKRGVREQALQAYTDALQHAANDPLVRNPIREQIEKLSRSPDGKIPPLRNPYME
jgi:Dolichyl-phosphate-mannose-protein mannosyltransferase